MDRNVDMGASTSQSVVGYVKGVEQATRISDCASFLADNVFRSSCKIWLIYNSDSAALSFQAIESYKQHEYQHSPQPSQIPAHRRSGSGIVLFEPCDPIPSNRCPNIRKLFRRNNSDDNNGMESIFDENRSDSQKAGYDSAVGR